MLVLHSARTAEMDVTQVQSGQASCRAAKSEAPRKRGGREPCKCQLCIASPTKHSRSFTRTPRRSHLHTGASLALLLHAGQPHSSRPRWCWRRCWHNRRQASRCVAVAYAPRHEVQPLPHPRRCLAHVVKAHPDMGHPLQQQFRGRVAWPWL